MTARRSCSSSTGHASLGRSPGGPRAAPASSARQRGPASEAPAADGDAAPGRSPGGPRAAPASSARRRGPPRRRSPGIRHASLGPVSKADRALRRLHRRASVVRLRWRSPAMCHAPPGRSPRRTARCAGFIGAPAWSASEAFTCDAPRVTWAVAKADRARRRLHRRASVVRLGGVHLRCATCHLGGRQGGPRAAPASSARRRGPPRRRLPAMRRAPSGAVARRTARCAGSSARRRGPNSGTLSSGASRVTGPVARRTARCAGLTGAPAWSCLGGARPPSETRHLTGRRADHARRRPHRRASVVPPRRRPAGESDASPTRTQDGLPRHQVLSGQPRTAPSTTCQRCLDWFHVHSFPHAPLVKWCVPPPNPLTCLQRLAPSTTPPNHLPPTPPPLHPLLPFIYSSSFSSLFSSSSFSLHYQLLYHSLISSSFFSFPTIQPSLPPLS